MKLSTDRLTLDLVTSADFPEIHEMNSYPQVAQFNTIGVPENLAVTTQLLESVLADEQKLAWTIRTKETAIFIGEIGMNFSSEKYRKAEIYYSLHPDYWGNGYASESVNAVLNYGFSVRSLHRIEAGVAVDNDRSVALLKKVGMTQEGTCRKILPLQSGWTDNYMYAILEDDPREF